MSEVLLRDLPSLPRVYGCPHPEKDWALSAWIMLVAVTKRTPVREILRAWNYRIRNAYAADTCPYIPPLAAMTSMTYESPFLLAELSWIRKTFLSDKQFSCLTTHRLGTPIHRYCPQCLAQDSIPYIRLNWRLSYNFVCPEHQSFLLEKCTCCQRPIDYSRFHAQRPRRSIGNFFRLCPNCSHDLSSSQTINPEPRTLDYLITLQNQLQQLIMSPFFRHPIAGTIASSKVFQSFMLEKIDENTGVNPRGASYAGLNYRRMFMNHHADICELFSVNKSLPDLS